MPLLRELFSQLQRVDWSRLVEGATDFELLQTRDDLGSWLMRWGLLKQYQERLPADYPRWQINAQEIFRSLSPADQAVVFAGWLALCR
jgi:hypothetical protein